MLAKASSRSTGRDSIQPRGTGEERIQVVGLLIRSSASDAFSQSCNSPPCCRATRDRRGRFCPIRAECGLANFASLPLARRPRTVGKRSVHFKDSNIYSTPVVNAVARNHGSL